MSPHFLLSSVMMSRATNSAWTRCFEAPVYMTDAVVLWRRTVSTKIVCVYWINKVKDSLSLFHLYFLFLLSDTIPHSSSPMLLQATLPFPACFTGPEAPAAPCPVQSPAVPLKTMKSAWLIIIIIGKRASCSVAMGTSDLWFCKRKQSLSIFREEKREGRRGGGGRQGVLDACPQNMILSSEVSSPVLPALSSVPPSLLPAIRLLFCSCSSPSLCSIEHCFLISVGFKGVWGHGVSSIVQQTAGFMNSLSLALYYHITMVLALSVEVYVHKAVVQGLKTNEDLEEK